LPLGQVLTLESYFEKYKRSTKNRELLLIKMA
jgi:hypothetical protein